MKRIILLSLVAVIAMSFKSETKILQTQLIVTVLDDLGTIQEGASVKLFKTVDDYNSGENQVLETHFTSKRGKTRFVGLEPIAYFVEVKNGKKDNALGGEKTEALDEGKINKINVIISE